MEEGRNGEEGSSINGEETQQGSNNNKEEKKKGIIAIPSYDQVLESLKPRQPTSLFRPSPSSSFSKAFSFVKNTEFYTPPPPTPEIPKASTTGNATERQTSGSSAAASSSSPAAFGNSRNAILVSHRQQGNPMLKHIRNVRWSFAEIVPDYLLGQSSCALYLSLRYHLLHSDYIYFRIRELQKGFRLRVVLCHIDVEDVVKPLLEVTKTALLHECTLLCAWSLEECARYLETIKIYENKPADSIQEKMDNDYLSRLTHALTSIRSVNKSDVVNLGSAFGSLSRIMDSSMEDLARCPGIGERKVKRLHDTFHEPFKRTVSIRPSAASTANSDDKKESTTEASTDNAEKEMVETSEAKEPKLNVRSALDVAFSKYSKKLRKKVGAKDVQSEKKGANAGTSSCDD